LRLLQPATHTNALTQRALTTKQTRTFAEKDGSFVLRDVRPGSHIISTYNTHFVYPEVRRA